MSSYVGKSFSNQTQDASCRMHTFGNYGAHSEFHESHYAYEGLDLGGSFSSQIPSNSLKREAINTTDRARSSAAVQRTQSCSALGSRSFVSTHGYNPLSHGLLSQKAEGNMEVMEKPSGKSRTDDIKMETTSAIKQQTNSTQRQSQSQPQIYPWMTKLHMSHAREEIVNLRARRSSWLHWIIIRNCKIVEECGGNRNPRLVAFQHFTTQTANARGYWRRPSRDYIVYPCWKTIKDGREQCCVETTC
uniref:Homeobox protein Hox-C3a-like n=1 Tax=Cyprinus carpio TaxID=7962 RepID=A0A8C1G4L8_CYPCA